jgi:hypothetical protein
MAVRHMVTFEWVEGIHPGHVDAVSAALAALPGVIPEIRSYQFGPDLGLNDGNSHYGVTALFDDEAGYLVYRDHPEHRRFIAEHIAGKVASRAAVQINVD